MMDTSKAVDAERKNPVMKSDCTRNRYQELRELEVDLEVLETLSSVMSQNGVSAKRRVDI